MSEKQVGLIALLDGWLQEPPVLSDFDPGTVAAAGRAVERLRLKRLDGPPSEDLLRSLTDFSPPPGEETKG